MKITIEEKDNRLGVIPYRKLVFGDECGSDIAEDWSYIFEQLQIYISQLKENKSENIGIQISRQSKIDKLQLLLDKYKTFHELTIDVTFSSL